MKVILLCVCMVLSSSFCIGAQTVKLAAVFAKTGNNALGNLKHFQGVRLAVEELNAQGGLLGSPLELIELDNESTPLGSKFAAKQAAEAGVTALIGASMSSHSLSIAPVMQEAKIPMISPASTNPQVTLTGNYIFRVCFIDSFQGKVTARFALNDLGAKTAAVLTNADSTYSLELAMIFIQEFQRQNGAVLWEADYLENASDFSAILGEVKRLKPDVVLVPGYTRDSAMIIKQARAMGISSVFLGGDGWGIQMYDYAGSELHGSYFCDQWHPDIPNQKSHQFIESFLKRYKDRKNLGGVMSYDACMLLADAVRRADSFDRDRIRAALAHTKNFKGATGTIRFDSNRNPDKSAVILKFQDRTTVFVKTVEP